MTRVTQMLKPNRILRGIEEEPRALDLGDHMHEQPVLLDDPTQRAMATWVQAQSKEAEQLERPPSDTSAHYFTIQSA